GVIDTTGGASAGVSGPFHCTPSPFPTTDPGVPTFLYWSGLPLSRGFTVRLAFAATEPRFWAVTEQCETPVFAAKLSGEHVCVSVTAPCVFTNATGIVTVLPPFAGTRLMRASYWPSATSGAEISIGNVIVASLVTCRSWLLLPTVMVT